MDTITLNVTEHTYKTAKEARKAGRIPMAYYGKGFSNRGFSAQYQEFRKAFIKGGHSTIMSFVTEKKETLPVLVHDLQYDPVSDDIMHVDVMAVDMNKKLRTRIPVVLKGVAPAVKELGAILVQNKDYLEVECLPKDLIHEIVVDLSSVVDYHSAIKVRDIKIPDTIKVLEELVQNVVTPTAPRATVEEEEAAAKAAADAAALAAGVVPAEGEAAKAAEGAEGAAKAEAKPEGKEGGKETKKEGKKEGKK